MSSVIRKHAATFGVALVTSLVAAGAGPAIAHGVHALFAHNSDKVDGLHAVKSGTSKKKRRGKLVATSRKTGRLPNNIIKKAPDANKLDGLDSTIFLKNTDPIDADTFDGLASSAFVKTGDPIDADTFDGLASSAFVKTTDDIDADTLDGQNSTDFLGANAKAADADLLDGFDSSAFVKTTDTVDADTLDGKNSSDFVDRAGTGFILVQADLSAWRTRIGAGSLTTTHDVDQTTFSSTSPTGNATHFIVPDLSLASYGKALEMAGVEVCYDASSAHLVDAIKYTRVTNTNGIATRSSETLDSADRSDEACRFYTVVQSELNGSSQTISLSVDSTWSDTGAILRLGRVTFMLEPTATNATQLS